ncbi:MAG TPA: TIGR03545 family protein [Gemmatimonadales bacterium]|nr:TIGR03545 family protein [Gemmatimonadales bacterium]
MNVKLFRWRAIGPLVVLFIILAVLVVLFAEPIARETTEDASGDLLGTEVDVAKLDLYPRDVAADFHRLQVADPFDPMRNLVEAADIHVKLDPYALAEEKLVVERLSLTGMRFNTRRSTRARAANPNGAAPQIVRAVREWTRKFDVPLLSLTPIDTIRQLVLDPGRLGTVQAANALRDRTDSTRRALEQGIQGLALDEVVDSARALAERLQHADPKTLGVQGTRDAVAAVQRTLHQIKQARARVSALEQSARAGVDLLANGLEQLDAARQRDYAFARSLLKLPSIAAPDIGKAFFGQVSVARFQQAMYWVQLARRYMPPGLLPHEAPGPDRLRQAGVDVHFPKERKYPAFLIEAGDVSFSIAGEGPLAGRYSANVQGVTSAPALYGKPTIVSASRRAAGPIVSALDVAAVLDHVGAETSDSIAADIAGLGLPTIDLPVLPVRLDPGRGTSRLHFTLRNGELSGRWAIASNKVAWSIDTAGRPLNDLERIVWQVVSGLDRLSVDARLSGTVRSPHLSLSSNLDDAVANRLEAVIGEQVARAEQLARARVDSLVSVKVEPVRREAAAVEAQARDRVAGLTQRLDEAQNQLEAALARITGGDLLHLPNIKLPS